MNVKLKVLTAALLAGLVGSATSAPVPGTPAAPKVTGGKVPGTPGTQRLNKPEMGAYTVIESVMEAVEGQIYANNCNAFKGTHILNVDTNKDGNGGASLITPAGLLELYVEKVYKDPLLGWAYEVGLDGSNTIAGSPINNISGEGNFDLGGGMMTHKGSFNVFFSTTGSSVPLEHLVIKDFVWKPAAAGVPPTFIDYGYQSLSKRGRGGEFYPQVKWWQTSKHNRSNGLDAKTQIHKDRVYNRGFNGACTIEVNLEGTDGFDGFYQSGTLVVK